jgi:hypothetical protein
MFGFRRSITNEECEVAKLKGSLDGLNYRLNALIKVSNRPDNRSDLTEEIKIAETEIEKTELKLKEMKALVNIQKNNKIY